MFKRRVKKSKEHITQGTEAKAKDDLSAIKKDFFNQKNWNYSKRKLKLHVEGNKFVIESKRAKVAYLSLFENNSNFNKAPQHRDTISMNEDFTARVTGQHSADVKVTIYLIEYDEAGKKLQTNRVFINREAPITVHPKTKNIRVAIRVFGKGEVLINNFRLMKHSIVAQEDAKTFKGKQLKNIKMACIFDEFSMESFADEVQLITFTPRNWKYVLTRNKPDLLMVESAWRGNNHTWEFQVGKYNNNQGNKRLKELTAWCKEQNIPTVFWNKEDPIHYEKFIDAASLFDYVFTTDANIIHQYKERVKHSRVYSMQFAANPKEHNPVMITKEKKNKISFAGSYYANRHPDRRKDMDEMLRITKEFGLEIFDRNYERNKSGNSHFMFPEYLQENIVGTLKYSQINQAYKNYKLILNVNSVKQSPTMFSRRVFEGLACGTPIVSSYSTGIKKTFHDIVAISNDEAELKNQIGELMNNDETYRDVALRGVREVFRHHTYKHRVKYILDKVKIPYQDKESALSIVFSVDTMEDFHRALEMAQKQTFKNKKIVMLISQFAGYETLLNEYNTEDISTYLRDYAYQYDTVNHFIETDYVTLINLDITYDTHFLEDLMHATIYSEADIVGKKSLFDGENYGYAPYEYEFVDQVVKDTAIYKVASLDKTTVEDLLQDEHLIEKLFKGSGATIYSDHQFGIKL